MTCGLFRELNIMVQTILMLAGKMGIQRTTGPLTIKGSTLIVGYGTVSDELGFIRYRL
jgi:hypothetical protein